MNSTIPNHRRFWLILTGVLIACCYLPMVQAPFDFVDDGNLVYHTSAPNLAVHFHIYWDKVQANVEHLGPFRPTLWAHWYAMAQLAHNDPMIWRVHRWLWTAISAILMLTLFQQWRIHPTAAIATTALAIWNPYRNDIWLSLTLAEGVAMPYALLALIAIKKAQMNKSHRWDLLAALSLLICLGCKNTFVAMIPAMLLIRCWPQQRDSGNYPLQLFVSCLIILLPALMPIGHYIYFQNHWQPGQYEVHGPSVDQFFRVVDWYRGAIGSDFIALPMVLAVGCLLWNRYRFGRNINQDNIPITEPIKYVQMMVIGGVLAMSGIAIYLPVDIMTGRYTMPGIWGIDILLAVFMHYFIVRLPDCWPKKIVASVFAISLVMILLACQMRQEKVIARSEMLWDVLKTVEDELPAGSTIAWIGSDDATKELNHEEGIHFYWHLLHRNKNRLFLRLENPDGTRTIRDELPVIDSESQYRILSHQCETLDWMPYKHWKKTFRFGKRQFACRLEQRYQEDNSATLFDQFTKTLMEQQFKNPSADAAEQWKALKPTDTTPKLSQ